MVVQFKARDLVLPKHVQFDDLVAWFPRRPTVRILVVVDTSVDVFTSSFGVGRVVQLVRDNVDGYVRFEVDTADLGTLGSALNVNPAPGPTGFKYTNFRFSSQVGGKYVIDAYDQVWCFGFAPGNDGGPDENIWNSAYATTDGDLIALTQWMNAGGGVLAMGDHDYLGASMCARIPRVRSMRRWTNGQNVPPVDGPGRFDTNRPQNVSQDASQTPNPAVIPFDAQSDAIPQPIDWRAYSVWSASFNPGRYRPHPILCGGELGVIDVLPDHPHEGWVYADDEIDLSATYTFGGALNGPEYPTVAGVQPPPEAIAWATALPDPPYNQEKQDSPSKRFAVIGAYNGDAAAVGRVVVDSTWHHWMDVNLTDLEAASPNVPFQKIARYYRNCAVWLSREGQRRRMLEFATFWASVRPAWYEDFVVRKNAFVTGGQGIDVIGRLASDCMVREWVDLYIDPRINQMLQKPDWPRPEPCWTCPPLELVRHAVLGGIIHAMIPLRDRLQRVGRELKAEERPSPEAFEKAALVGAQNGMEAFGATLRANLESLTQYTRADSYAIKHERAREMVPPGKHD